jgi:hypothetical protein
VRSERKQLHSSTNGSPSGRKSSASNGARSQADHRAREPSRVLRR